MQMGLAHDHGAGLAQARRHCRIGLRNAEFLSVETGAARRRKTHDVKAVFDRNRNTEKGWPLLRLRKPAAQRLGFRQGALLVDGQKHIVAGIAVGAGKRFAGRPRRTRRGQGVF